jgi:hypothetical protein
MKSCISLNYFFVPWATFQAGTSLRQTFTNQLLQIYKLNLRVPGLKEQAENIPRHN